MISIIITAYKEEKTIGRAIEAILQNNPDNCEIMIISPDDATLNAAKKYAIKNKNIKFIKDAGKGKPSALNLAFKKASGEILVLTDGDVYVSKNSINNLTRFFKNPKIGAVSGCPVSVNNRKTMLGFWSHVLTDTADKRRKKALKIKKRFYCSGYLYAIRSGIANEIPKETLSEDGLISHLIYERGYEIIYSPEARVYVKYPTTLKEWIAQKKRSAGGYNQIKKWIGKEIRSFRKESFGIFQVLKYARTLKEIFYTFILILFRIYLWGLIFIEINLRKKELKEIWLRAKTTK